MGNRLKRKKSYIVKVSGKDFLDLPFCSGSKPKFNAFFHPPSFVEIHFVVMHKPADKQTNRQGWKHNLLGKGNNVRLGCTAFFFFLSHENHHGFLSDLLRGLLMSLHVWLVGFVANLVSFGSRVNLSAPSGNKWSFFKTIFETTCLLYKFKTRSSWFKKTGTMQLLFTFVFNSKI